MPTSDQQLASTPRWLATTATRFVGSMLMWGLVLLVFGSAGLYITGFIYAEAIPFIWLSILGFAITLSGFEPDNDEQITLRDAMEMAAEMSPWERRLYLVTVVTVVTGMIGLQVTVIGIVSAFAAYELSLPIVAMGIAVFGPPVDAWFGRNVGVSLGAIGLRLTVLLMKGVAILNNISPEIPGKAGSSVQGFAA